MGLPAGNYSITCCYVNGLSTSEPEAMSLGIPSSKGTLDYVAIKSLVHIEFLKYSRCSRSDLVSCFTIRCHDQVGIWTEISWVLVQLPFHNITLAFSSHVGRDGHEPLVQLFVLVHFVAELVFGASKPCLFHQVPTQRQGPSYGNWHILRSVSDCHGEIHLQACIHLVNGYKKAFWTIVCHQIDSSFILISTKVR